MKTRLLLTILREWGELRSQSHLTHRKGGEVEFGAEKDESETSVGRLRHQILMWIRSWKGSFPTAAPFSPAPSPSPPSRKRAAAAGPAAAAKRWGAVGKSVGGARDGRRTEWKTGGRTGGDRPPDRTSKVPRTLTLRNPETTSLKDGPQHPKRHDTMHITKNYALLLNLKGQGT